MTHFLVIDTPCSFVHLLTGVIVIKHEVCELRKADGAHPSSWVSSGLFCFRATPGTDILDEYEALCPWSETGCASKYPQPE